MRRFLAFVLMMFLFAGMVLAGGAPNKPASFSVGKQKITIVSAFEQQME